jgi:hypothetical protein
MHCIVGVWGTWSGVFLSFHLNFTCARYCRYKPSNLTSRLLVINWAEFEGHYIHIIHFIDNQVSTTTCTNRNEHQTLQSQIEQCNLLNIYPWHYVKKYNQITMIVIWCPFSKKLFSLGVLHKCHTCNIY